MLKNMLAIALLGMFAAGCGVKAQTYVMTKERADIREDQGGNAGYIAGSGTYREPDKKTRRVYVLELTKPIPASEVKKIEEELSSISKEVVVQQASLVSEPLQDTDQPMNNGRVNVVIPSLEDDSTMAGSVPDQSVSYTVQKDDTLQKIAKKFYNSYGKWVKIYDANKDKIKNPNFVKPGTVLLIPSVEEGNK